MRFYVVGIKFESYYKQLLVGTLSTWNVANTDSLDYAFGGAILTGRYINTCPIPLIES